MDSSYATITAAAATKRRFGCWKELHLFRHATKYCVVASSSFFLIGVLVGGVVVGTTISSMNHYALKTSFSSAATADAWSSIVIHDDLTDKKKNSTIYCHLHVEKTAGTTLNGYLALHYERVCGNKGYSYSYSRHNTLLREANLQTGPDGNGRVKDRVMDETGYEDCDYISWERPLNTWFSDAPAMDVKNGKDDNVNNDDDDHDVPRINLLNDSKVHYQLHLPCRETISHFLSRCNHREYKFDCARPAGEQIANCINTRKYPRFRRFLNETFDLRCFNASKLLGYFQYMDQRLQRKRTAFQSEYYHRDTNRPRQPSCLEDAAHAKQKDELQDWLMQNDDYYSFCEECMGTWQELPLK